MSEDKIDVDFEKREVGAHSPPTPVAPSTHSSQQFLHTLPLHFLQTAPLPWPGRTRRRLRSRPTSPSSDHPASPSRSESPALARSQPCVSTSQTSQTVRWQPDASLCQQSRQWTGTSHLQFWLTSAVGHVPPVPCVRSLVGSAARRGLQRRPVSVPRHVPSRA